MAAGDGVSDDRGPDETGAEGARQGHGHEGTLIAGRYRLLERLGAGGMGRVWRAHDESLDCDVALKEVWLPPMLSDAERADRLTRAQREARNAARLRNHPHIVSVHDMVSDQGLPWIVMDLIPSRNLSQIIEEFGPLPLEQVATIGAGVLEALTASHAAGILHRDVKPANVLLTNDGRVLLTDFGIAVQESDLTMTSSGVLVGSPEYVAPERARGEASRAASDLFSLGATLYFAAEGRSPFQRETAVGVLTAILFEEAARVTRLPALDPLVKGLLEKDPNRRFDAVRTRDELARLGGRGMLGGPAKLGDTAPEGVPDPTLLVPAAGEAGAAGGGAAGAVAGAAAAAGLGAAAAGGVGAAAPGPNPFLAPPTMAAHSGPTPGAAPNPWAQPGPLPGPQAGPPPGPHGPQGPYPGGPMPQMPGMAAPVYFQPPKKNTTGRNVGIGVGAVAVVGAIVAVIALTGGKKSDDVVTINHTNTIASTDGPTQRASDQQPTTPATTDSATSDAPTDSPTSDQPTTDQPTTSFFDPASLDSKSTDQTPLTIDALLPPSFTDSKGVLYKQTNQWTADCVSQYESSKLKNMLNKYHCGKQAISTYVDADGKILVDLEVMPLDDAQSVTNAFHDMQSASAFTIDDWGIWCPKPGPGSQICSQGQDTSNAQQYGYIQPNHRYLVHAVALYVNLTEDQSAQDWLKPAATAAAKAGGPQNYGPNQ